MKRQLAFYMKDLTTMLSLSVLSFILAANAAARELSLNEAIEVAIGKSSRGEIIDGDLEVAEQNYFAEKINFYIPEISINGNAPVYNVAESFRFFGGLDEKQLIRTTDRDFNANIQLNQSLITGGSVNVTGNIWNRRSEYPLSGIEVTETSNQGIFDFTFEQPLLKPSEPKNKLNNTRDDLEIARLTTLQDFAALKKEVTDAYVGMLQTDLKLEIADDKVESARLKNGIDSVKFVGLAAVKLGKAGCGAEQVRRGKRAPGKEPGTCPAIGLRHLRANHTIHT
jgi:outer membrane protein TolC